MKQTGRWLYTGAATGAFNMAADEALLMRASNPGSEPTLRIFAWNPPAVTLGYGQNASRELDLAKCRRAGLDVVRRLTGGRAVLHWDELTYSVVWPVEALGGGLEDSFQLIGRCLVAGLQRFGIDATLERSRPARDRRRERELSPPCFASTSRWEVKYLGRKLIGSAQRRIKNAVLQHGSLLLGPEHKQLLDLLPEGGESTRKLRIEELDRGSVDLRSTQADEIDVDRLARSIAEGFAQCAELELRLDDFDFSEKETIDKLVETKYGDPLWNRTAPEDFIDSTALAQLH